MTEPLSRILNRAGISTTVRSRGSLRELLVHPKDSLATSDKTGAVYYLPCSGANGEPCGENGSYVGETERTAESRLKEHFSTAVQSGTSTLKSAVMAHARDKNHHFRPADLTILSSGNSNWHERGVKEAVYIRGLQPSINRDQGRHQLPSHFDSLIKEAVTKPPPPVTHNPEIEPLLRTSPRRQGRPRRNPTTASQTSILSSQTPTNSQDVSINLFSSQPSQASDQNNSIDLFAGGTP